MYRITLKRLRKVTRVAQQFCDPRALQCQQIDRELEFPKGTSAHLVKVARKLGLLMVRTELPMPSDTRLGSKLGKLFFPTQMLVIDTAAAGKPASNRLSDARREDDLLHEMLGRAAAQYLSNTLKNYDLVGVGAGRAVFHTARSLARLPGAHEKRKEVTVMSLHGRAVRNLWRPTSRYARQSVDALRVIHTLATSLPMAREQPLDLPLIQPSPEAVRRALDMDGKAWFLSHRDWARRRPSLALVGLGIMGRPRVRGDSSEQVRLLRPKATETRPIAKELNELRHIDRLFFDKHGYVPISDVCDRLFWVPDPDEAPSLMEKAIPLIRAVNERLLTVDTGLPPRPRQARDGQSQPGSLDQVQEIILVAGGPYKVRALDRVLRHRRPNQRRFADTVVTDVATGEALLELAGRDRLGARS